MSVGIPEQHWGFHFVLGGVLCQDYKSTVLVTNMTKFYMLALNIFNIFVAVLLFLTYRNV
jgi:hypothetical protein